MNCTAVIGSLPCGHLTADGLKVVICERLLAIINEQVALGGHAVVPPTAIDWIANELVWAIESAEKAKP